MIHQIELDNFKGHHHTNIPLGRMTVLVGPNGSGKTSVLQALHYLGLLRYQDLSNMFLNENAPRFLVRNGQNEFSLRLKGTQDEPTSSESLRWDFSMTIHLEKPQNLLWKPDYSWSVSEETGKSENWMWSIQDKKVPEVMHQVPPFAEYLRLNSRRLAALSYWSEPTPEPRIQSDGWGLPTLISHLKTYEDEAFLKLENAVRRVVPQVQRIRVRKSSVQVQETKLLTVDKVTIPYQDTRTVPGDELVLDMVGAKEIPAHAASEGTLLAIGLLAVLFNPHSPRIVLLDDVEKGLHPKAQRELVGVLKQVLSIDRTLQIVMTTHSPYIVDELEPSEICVMAADKRGNIAASRLDQHPRALQALQLLTTGEFLSAEGEEWVLSDQEP